MDEKRISKINELFESASEDVFNKTVNQYEEEIEIDKSLIVTDRDFFEYVEKRIEALRAHNERYTEMLVKRAIYLCLNEKD